MCCCPSGLTCLLSALHVNEVEYCNLNNVLDRSSSLPVANTLFKFQSMYARFRFRTEMMVNVSVLWV